MDDNQLSTMLQEAFTQFIEHIQADGLGEEYGFDDRGVRLDCFSNYASGVSGFAVKVNGKQFNVSVCQK